MDFFYCDHCVNNYNTKDGFIGPHVNISKLTITNSVAIGNMGANWKWGGGDDRVNTTNFRHNLTVNNCTRMSQPMEGVPSTYNQYLSAYCRAGGNGLASVIPIGSTWNIESSTFITAQQIAWLVECPAGDATCPSTINSRNNVFVGYTNPNNPYGPTNVPALYYFGPGIVLNTANNDEFGMRWGDCPEQGRRSKVKSNAERPSKEKGGHPKDGSSADVLCVDPLLTDQPKPGWSNESALDVFNPFVAGNAFYPTAASPVNGAGMVYPGIPATDYYGVAQTTPPVIGGVVASGGTPPIPPQPSTCHITVRMPPVVAPSGRSSSPEWTTVGQEGQTLTLPVGTLVRYGNVPNNAWSVTFLSPAPPFVVSNDLVGDPAQGFEKVLQSTPTPSPAPPDTICYPVPSTAAFTLTPKGDVVITITPNP
jgi:hypothetical protein